MSHRRDWRTPVHRSTGGISFVGRYRRDWLVTDSKDADGNNVKPGEQLPEHGRFFTEQEAAEFIGALPDAETGRYSIDAPPGWDGERTS